MRLLRGFSGLGRTIGRIGKRFRGEEDGATAIEFAMVIGPFLGLLFAIMEIALIYFAEFSIDNGVHKAARLIRLGQVQKAGMSQATFKSAVCADIPSFMACDSDVIIDVRSFNSFGEAAANLPNPLKPDGTLSGNFAKFIPGGPAKVVVVTLFYDWRMFTKMPGLGDFTGKIGLGLGNMPDGSRLISASTAFRTETYQ